MSETLKHTPGPWVSVESRFASETLILGPQVRVDDDEGAGRDTIAIIPMPSGCEWGPEHDSCTLGRPETDANASLIAAAPEMLEALQSAADFIERQGYSEWIGGSLVELREAISKATGADQ